jgi:hypothetical protein
MAFLHSGSNSKINLSAKQMLEISQEISRDFTPCFFNQKLTLVEKDRFTASELLDISVEIRRNFAPKVSFSAPELTLLPVDPGHLHVYWSIAENQETVTPENECDDHLTLRIYGQPHEQSKATEIEHMFDVAIDSTDSRQQVFLPVAFAETAYSAEIGKFDVDDKFIVFAHSNIIHAPRGSAAWCQVHQNANACPSKNTSGQGISKLA